MAKRRAVLFAAAIAAACGDAPTRPGPKPPGERPVVDEFITGIVMPTYERSGETVHPDFALAPAWWAEANQGYLAITPYPNGDATKENPSLFAGELDRWVVPKDAPNPVRTATSGHLSDPDIVFDPETRQLFMYYRQVASGNRILLTRTGDAQRWSESELVVEGPNHTIVSPSVVRREGGQWLMWSVNSGSAGCSASSTQVELRRSADGVSWGKPQVVEIPSPHPGFFPWHLDVQWIPERNEFWAVFNAKDAFNCGTTVVYLATSADGMHWTTHSRPIAVAGQVPELDEIVYRTTFKYDAEADEVLLWFSGAHRGRRGLVWRTVLQRVTRARLFERASLRSTLMNEAVIPSSVPLADPP